MLIVGCDWAKDNHRFALMDPQGHVLEELSVAHRAAQLQTLASLIARHEPDPAHVHVVLEMHDGALLAWLLNRGYTVYGLNPKSAQRARERYRPSGAKDDRSDALLHAEIFRTDGGRTIRPVRLDSPATQELLALVELRTDRIQQRTAALQRLRAVLGEWSPNLDALCEDLTLIWPRNLLRRFPLDTDLAAAPTRTVHAFARRHRLAEKTRQRLQQAHDAPALHVPSARLQALRMDVRFLVESVDHLTEAITSIDQRLRQIIDAHPDVHIFRSLPITGLVSIAGLMAGFGEHRDSAPTFQRRCAMWGVAPVTIRSGRSRQVRCRRAADHTLRQILLDFAFNTAFTNGCWAVDYYQRKRREGLEHRAALRCLAQRWVKVIHRLWIDRSTYDEQRHQLAIQQRQQAAA